MATGVKTNALVGGLGQSSRQSSIVPLWPVLSVDDWAALLVYHFRLLGRALVWKPVPEGPRVYEPDRSPRAPGRFG